MRESYSVVSAKRDFFSVMVLSFLVLIPDGMRVSRV
jgi:hypothetical protein